MEAVRSFQPGQVRIAVALGLTIEFAIFLLLAAAGTGGSLKPEQLKEAREIPMKVKPVLDELPLLKKGSKQKYKLPDIWRPPPPKRRYKARSAPSPTAEKTPDAIPTTQVAKIDEKPPPPDAAVAKQVDEEIPDTEETSEEQKLDEEGAEDGVAEGTETDPLKARAISLYRMKLIAWFNARFRPEASGGSCEEMRKLNASVSVSIGGDREIRGYVVVRASGDSVFDARVRQTMDGIVSSGASLPPPPPNYPDILNTSESVRYTGAAIECKSLPKRSRRERGEEEPAPGGGGESPPDDEPGDEGPGGSEDPPGGSTPEEPRREPAPAPEGPSPTPEEPVPSPEGPAPTPEEPAPAPEAPVDPPSVPETPPDSPPDPSELP